MKLQYTHLVSTTDQSRETLGGEENLFYWALQHILLDNQQNGSAEAQDSMVKNEQTGELGGRKNRLARNNEILVTWILDFLRDIHWMIIIF